MQSIDDTKIQHDICQALPNSDKHSAHVLLYVYIYVMGG